VEIRPTETGTYRAFCAEFCGLDHWRMSFDVEVVSPEAFRAFVAEQQRVPVGPGLDPNGRGDIGGQASVAR